MTSTADPTISQAGQGKRTYLSDVWYQEWKVTGETTNGALDSWFEVVPPQIGPPEHKHDHYDECFWVVKGTFLIKLAGRFETVSEGAWIFVPRGTAHGFRNVGTESGQLLIEAVSAAKMDKYFEEVSVIFASQPPDQQALQRVNAKYGIMEVGPPLQEGAK